MIINILVAAYNGEKYLPAQLDSLITQTEDRRIIYIRDDGSTDKTGKIIEEYVSRYPGIIIPVLDGKGNLGVIGNFMALLSAGKADYYMLCDQDDVWEKDKVEKTLQAMKEAEKDEEKEEYLCKTPVLVHTDLAVVGEDLSLIHPSFVEKLGLDAANATFASLIYSNVVTGCTVMMNAAMAAEIRSIPKTCLMHDQWLALLAAGTGKRVYLPEATIKYRQHGDNQMGAKGRSVLDRALKLINIPGYVKGIERTRRLRDRQFAELADFYLMYKDELLPEAKKSAEDLLAITTLPKKERKELLISGGYLPKSRYDAATVILYYTRWIGK